MNLKCVIIDAYGPSQFYFNSLVKRGCDVIHIQSSANPPPAFQQMVSDKAYLTNIIHTGDIESTFQQLSKYSPISFLFSGFETGIVLADKLCARLNLKISNDINLSAARTNKFTMVETLKLAGVATPNFFLTQEVESAINWIHKHERYPAVIKPTNSAGSDGVYICNNDDEVRNNFSKILGATNVLGNENNNVLVESFLKGTEYIVDSVSFDGKHYVTDIWQSTKRLVDNQRVIYDKEELLPSTGHIQDKLTHYIKTCLDALGLKYGPAHSEIMLTEAGPILIELNPRLHGGMLPQAQEECLGHNQLELTLDAFTNTNKFFEYIKKPYSLEKNMTLVVGISEKERSIDEVSLTEALKNLKSYYFHRVRVRQGSQARKTTDLASSPLFVYLVSDKKEQINDDYLFIKNKLVGDS